MIMYSQVFTFFLLFTTFTQSYAKVGFGIGEQEWGHAKVRPGAYLFWWLYYTTANVTSFYEKPLVIWLQGGPGASSTGFGNFELIGPLNTHLKPREYNWVDHYNVLFIDSPVGTGFSYVKGKSYATTSKQIVDDLIECVKAVFEKDPKLSKVPTFIVGESYGGKTAIQLAKTWHIAEKIGHIKSNLMGVAMGDAWISPIDSVLSWGPYLLQMGAIDDIGYKIIEKAANDTRKAVENGHWESATDEWMNTENVIMKVNDYIDFYNILTKISYKGHMRDEVNLYYLMNLKVKPVLNLTVDWNEYGGPVFGYLVNEFMKPAIKEVEYVLNNTQLRTVVYNGQLDLIVDTPGTMNWVNRMHWHYQKSWQYSTRKPLVVDNIIEGYIKKHKNFAVYWINRAGHMIPKDNPAAGLEMMERFTSNLDYNNNNDIDSILDTNI